MATSTRTLTFPARYAAEFLSTLGCAVLIALVALAAWLSYRHHGEAERVFQLRHAEDMALVLQTHTRDTLASVDDAVRRIKKGYELNGARMDLAGIMEESRDITGYLAVATVADEAGRLVVSNTTMPPGASIADREHFRVHIEHDTGRPFIGKPIVGRVSGKWSFQVTRRVNRSDGSFGGVAGIGVDLSYWNRLLEEGALGSGTTVALIGMDGVARARHSRGSPAGDSEAIDWGFLMRAVAAGQSRGHAIAETPASATRTWSYRTLDDYPLIVAVGVEENDVLGRLSAIKASYAGGVVAIAILAGLFTVGLLLFFARQRAHLSERARAAEALSESEARFRSAFEQAGVGMGLRRAGRRDVPWQRVNRKLCDFLGYSEEELLRLPAATFNPPEEERIATEMNERLARGELGGYSREKQYLRKDGTLAWANTTMTVVRGPDGHPTHTLSVIVDIGDRKRAEQAVRESERRYEELFDMSPLPAWVREESTLRILAVNQATLDVYGYTREELSTMTTTDLQAPHTREAHLRANRPRPRVAMRGERRSHVSKGGRIMEVEVNSSPVEFGGRPARLVISNDMTARLEADRALRESEEFFRAAFEQAGVGMGLRSIDPHNPRWLRVNGTLCEILGYAREELLQLTSLDITPPEDRQSAIAINEQLLLGKTANFAREKRYVRKDGRIIWASVFLSVVRGADGHPTHVISVINDITERRRVEEALCESEHRFRAVFDHAGVGITLRPALDRHLPWLAVNDRFCEITGYAREELLRLSTADLTMPDDREAAARDNERLMRGEVSSYTREKRIVRKDGTPVWLVISIASVRDAEGRPHSIIATHQDVTARKLAEDRLRESEERLRAIIAAEPECVKIIAADGTLLDMNPAGLRMLEAGSLEEVKRRPLTSYVAPAYQDAFARLHQRVMRGESGTLEFEAVGLAKSRRWLETHAVPLRDASGNIYALLGVTRDVTENRKAQEALASERNLLRAIIDNLPDHIHVKDRDLRIMLANEAWIKARAAGRRELGMTVHDLLSHERALMVDAEDRAVMESGRASVPRETVREDPQYGKRVFLTTKTPLRNPAGHAIGTVAISRDITDLRRRALEVEKLNAALEARVAERTAELTAANQELESFAYSVSHDRRAPLRYIEGLAAALQQDYAKRLDATGRDYLERVRAAALRMGYLIEDLLRLSQVTRMELHKSEVDLSALAGEIAEELQREHPGRKVTFRISPGLRARGDRGLLRSALANLIQNAWKFTGTSRTATIEFGARRQDGASVYFVRDDGAGFDMAQAGRLFGAFQRLHAERDFPGTGIGLATVRRVMRRHGGDAWAESEVGKGATFFFTLDSGAGAVQGTDGADAVAPAPAAVGWGARKDSPPASRQRSAVLLVDDDEDMLTLAKRALAADGCPVFTASHGEEGLAILRTHEVGVVVSDYSMPGMNGAELLQRVAALYPRTVRIILSGQACDDAVEEAIRKGEIYRHVEKQRGADYLRTCIQEGLIAVLSGTDGTHGSR
jgi:PAS domain S-box-containing protein